MKWREETKLEAAGDEMVMKWREETKHQQVAHGNPSKFIISNLNPSHKNLSM